jgi:hypothetical protein
MDVVLVSCKNVFEGTLAMFPFRSDFFGLKIQRSPP